MLFLDGNKDDSENPVYGCRPAFMQVIAGSLHV